jgi:hypothetical protein
MSADIRCEDGELLGDRLSTQIRHLSTSTDQTVTEYTLLDDSSFPNLNYLRQGTSLSTASTYVHTGVSDAEAEASLPLTPDLRPRRRVDPRLSVSTSVKAWRALDD